MMVNLAMPYSSKTSNPRSTAAVFYAPEQPDFLFEQGERITIWCQPVDRPLRMEWELCRNLVNTSFLKGSCLSEFDGSFRIEISTADLLPAFYELKGRIYFTETQFIDVATTFGWRALEQKLLPVVPDDFEAFWRAEKEKVDCIAPAAHAVLENTLKGNLIGYYNLARAALPERYDDKGEKYDAVEIYRVQYTSYNGVRIHGWFSKPVGEGPFPGMLILPGAGNNARSAPVEHARHGYAALDIQVHGFPADLPAYPPPREQGAYTTPQDYTHYAIYLHALQAVNALVQLPSVDASRLCAVGGSQGGRLTLVVSALDSRIRCSVAGITHFSNIPWLHWTERLNRQKDSGNRDFTEQELVRDEQLRVESYYDVMNFASLIRCPVLMNAGLIDRVSPATGVFSAYRKIKGSQKAMIPLPNLGHDWSPAFDRCAWKWLDSQLNA